MAKTRYLVGLKCPDPACGARWDAYQTEEDGGTGLESPDDATCRDCGADGEADE